MCIAIYKPEGSVIEKTDLLNAFHNNDDGAGFAVAKHGKIEIYKGYFQWNRFWNDYAKHSKDACLIHFRIATHGPQNKLNCHPFRMCNNRFVAAHNGILSIDTASDPSMSDTRHFMEYVMEPLLATVPPSHPSMVFLTEAAIGNSNKIIVMDTKGEATIYNENEGVWDHGSWFSNLSYTYSYAHQWEAYGGVYNSIYQKHYPEIDWSGDKGPSENGVTDEELLRLFPDFRPEMMLDSVKKYPTSQEWLEAKEQEMEREREKETKKAIFEKMAEEGEWE